MEFRLVRFGTQIATGPIHRPKTKCGIHESASQYVFGIGTEFGIANRWIPRSINGFETFPRGHVPQSDQSIVTGGTYHRPIAVEAHTRHWITVRW